MYDVENLKSRREGQTGQVIIYAATAGLKVPKKHIQLGLVTKSLTGSKKLLNVLDRYGHSISYTAAEEIETELKCEGTKENFLIPNDMKAGENTSVGLAFDNYNRYMESFSGKNTLHDTLCIAYQLRNDAEDGNEDQNENPEETVIQKGKRRRRYKAMNLDVEPYRKKPKMVNSKMIQFTDERRLVVPESSTKSRHDDIKQMISFVFLKKAQPMWIGWNAKKEIRS